MERSMPSNERSKSRARRGAAVAIAAVAAWACATAPARIDASDGAALARESALRVELGPLPAATDASGAAPSSGAAARSDAAAPGDAAAVRARVEDALRAKGYAIDDGAGIVLTLDRRREPGPVTSWSSDTDATAPRVVERMHAVVSLEARAPGAEREVWRCDAREVLPKPGTPFAGGEEAIWERLLEHALARIPARS